MHLSENEADFPPRKRQLRSITVMNRKKASTIPISDPESGEESSDTEFLGGFIVDDDCED
jgi:hypothetical protein